MGEIEGHQQEYTGGFNQQSLQFARISRVTVGMNDTTSLGLSDSDVAAFNMAAAE